MDNPTTGKPSPSPLSEDVIVQPEGVSAAVVANNPTALGSATAHPTGLSAVATLGKVIAIGTVRKEINRLCRETYTRALAWCLYVHAESPHLLAEDLFDWLDEIGAASPKGRKTWNEYHRNYKADAEKKVSDSRTLLRKNGLPYNN